MEAERRLSYQLIMQARKLENSSSFWENLPVTPWQTSTLRLHDNLSLKVCQYSVSADHIGNTHGMFSDHNLPWELPEWESQPASTPI